MRIRVVKDFIEMRAIVSGKVQGVGFRTCVRNHAVQLGLKGTVRNLANGAVEIHAQGKRQQLDALLERIQKDTGKSHIQSIATDYYSPTYYYDDFAVIYSSQIVVKR